MAWQVPVVPPSTLSTQRAGAAQMGPLRVSQPEPSAAGGRQVPDFEFPGFWQKALATHSMTPPSMVPQGWEAVAVATGAQTLPAGTLQYSPKRASHRLPPSVRSQFAPNVARGTQAPSALAVLPRQVSPGAQALESSQASEADTGAAQVTVILSQTRPGPQLWLKQESPAPGAGAHVPQIDVFGMRQLAVAHCPETAHTLPASRGPAGGWQAVGRVPRA